jgi:dTDP-glucose 4,6-dehydratase
VVKTILKILGKPESLISFVQDRLGHDWRYAMDISLARKELGFVPKVGFEEGIKRTVHWYVENQAWLDMIKATQKNNA